MTTRTLTENLKLAAPLYVIGLGPGNENLLVPEALHILEKVQCIAGYNLYLDLLPPQIKFGKHLINSGMRQEEERCVKAVQAALAGEETALVCSGDPGIYALASLVLEILERMQLIDILPFSVIPGIPAMCAAAAKLGAPLNHDFACISLSDLLTPWSLIELRLKHALAADFVCVLYNPRSHGRPDYLGMALDFAREYRTPQCPVAMARNVARKGEKILLSTLADFKPELADMLSLIIIGNSESRQIGKFMLTPRGYSNKGRVF